MSTVLFYTWMSFTNIIFTNELLSVVAAFSWHLALVTYNTGIHEKHNYVEASANTTCFLLLVAVKDIFYFRPQRENRWSLKP